MERNTSANIGSRQIKAELRRLLIEEDVDRSLSRVLTFPERLAINPLFSFLYDPDTLLKWRAVTAMGMVTDHLAKRDIAAARVILRRLMWNLNDESGGIGWGSPEAMGEILARNLHLADDYHHILISYLMEDGNYLEHEMLQRGLLWGIGRLAHARPGLVTAAAAHLNPFLASPDPVKRGLSAWAAGALKQAENIPLLRAMIDDPMDIEVYMDGRMKKFPIRDLAMAALSP